MELYLRLAWETVRPAPDQCFRPWTFNLVDHSENAKMHEAIVKGAIATDTTVHTTDQITSRYRP
jgi:hypothetical protein